MRESRGSLIQKGVDDSFSLDQESYEYLCSESMEALEWSLTIGKNMDGEMIKSEPLEGGEQRSLNFLLRHEGNPLRGFRRTEDNQVCF